MMDKTGARPAARMARKTLASVFVHKKTKAIHQEADHGWHIVSQDCFKLLVSSSERYGRSHHLHRNGLHASGVKVGHFQQQNLFRLHVLFQHWDF